MRAVAFLALATLSACAAQPDAHIPPFARAPYEPISREAVVQIALRDWRLFGQVIDDDSAAPAEKPERASGLWQRVGEYWWLGLNTTDPEVAWVGLTEDDAKKQGIKVGVGKFPWAASGRAIANGRDEGFTKLIFDAESHRILGAGIVGTGAGDLISELALAVEMGSDAVDIGKTIHPHPTLGESVGMAAELYEGVCTDMPPVKKK